MWIVYAFLSALFAGLTSILAKIGIKNTDSHLATALRTVVVVVFSILMVFVTGSYKNNIAIPNRSLLFLVLSGLTTGASWICYFKALQLGDVNKVVPIDKSSTILTMALAFIFLGEPLTAIMVFAMVFIAIGTYLMIQKKEGSETVSTSNSWLIFALFSSLFASLTSILGKIGIENVDSNIGNLIRTAVVLLMAWLIVFLLNKQSQIKDIDKHSWIFIILSGFATGLSWFFYYRALQEGRASIVVPIDKLSIIITVSFAYIFLKEKLPAKALIGLVLIVIGTLALLIY